MDHSEKIPIFQAVTASRSDLNTGVKNIKKTLYLKKINKGLYLLLHTFRPHFGGSLFS